MATKKKTAAEKREATRLRVAKWRDQNPEYYKGYQAGLRAGKIAAEKKAKK